MFTKCSMLKMRIKTTLKNDCRFCTFLYVNSYLLWYFFLITIYQPLYLIFCMKCEVSQTRDVNPTQYLDRCSC